MYVLRTVGRHQESKLQQARARSFAFRKSHLQACTAPAFATTLVNVWGDYSGF